LFSLLLSWLYGYSDEEGPTNAANGVMDGQPSTHFSSRRYTHISSHNPRLNCRARGAGPSHTQQQTVKKKRDKGKKRKRERLCGIREKEWKQKEKDAGETWRKEKEEERRIGEMKPLFLPAHIMPSTRIYERIR
jgi:hypothetical protein